MTFRDKDKLSDNWRLSLATPPVTTDNIETYRAKYGQERTLGYIEALADIMAEVSWMLDSVTPGLGGYARSPSKTQNMLTQFESQKRSLIEYVDNHNIAAEDVVLALKLKQR